LSLFNFRYYFITKGSLGKLLTIWILWCIELFEERDQQVSKKNQQASKKNQQAKIDDEECNL
jgi:hypothetical protein